MIIQTEITLPALPRGFHLITSYIENQLKSWPEKGLLNIFLQHTSAALTINENTDRNVSLDLNDFFSRLASETQNYLHDSEGTDDMPAHIKSSLLGVSLNIPVEKFRLKIGIWQGIYLCEFRNKPHKRRITLSLYY